LLLGPNFVTDDLVEKAQDLVDPRFTVEVFTYDGTYIYASGIAILAGTAGTIGFRVVDILDPANIETTGVLSITVFPSIPN